MFLFTSAGFFLFAVMTLELFIFFFLSRHWLFFSIGFSMFLKLGEKLHEIVPLYNNIKKEFETKEINKQVRRNGTS